jgi:hypothetical protein
MEKEVERRISHARGDVVVQTLLIMLYTSAHKTNINDQRNTT